MRNIIVLMVFLASLMLFSSVISAEIIIMQQPKEIYNIGDTMNVPVKVVALKDTKSSFKMSLLCDGFETEVYKADVELKKGEEQLLSPIIILDKSRAGNQADEGTCNIKASLLSDYSLTDEFEISDLILIEIKEKKSEVAPGENTFVKGDARKENGELVDGFVSLKTAMKNYSRKIDITDSIRNGNFYLNFSFPKDTKAGLHLLKLEVYEKESTGGNITNKGLIEYGVSVKQIPTSLEIIFENSEIEPGTNLRVKAILHDQTGEKIRSSTIITIKDKNSKILKQEEKSTDEFLEFSVPYDEAPSKWSVFAISNKLSAEANFMIAEKENLKITLINRTLIITNTGNVPYNKNLLVKVGEENLNILLNLGVGETQKYILSAPDGNYDIEVISNGESKLTGNAVLTGNAIELKRTGNVLSLVRHPFVWFFIIGILGFVAFMIVRKGYKRSFIGYIRRKHKKKTPAEAKKIDFGKKLVFNTGNKAELSLSIKGEKQSASSICINIKNFDEITKPEQTTKETLQRIVDLAEESKAFVYENQNNLFFIFSPITTKTFRNEKKAVEIAQKIKEIIEKHNKLYKQKIEFGISLNYGEIIAKKEPKDEALKFMSLGSLISGAKKISSISSGEIFLSEKIREKLGSDVKAEKQKKEGIIVYTVKDIRADSEQHKQFIKSFLDRIERKK